MGPEVVGSEVKTRAINAEFLAQNGPAYLAVGVVELPLLGKDVGLIATEIAIAHQETAGNYEVVGRVEGDSLEAAPGGAELVQ